MIYLHAFMSFLLRDQDFCDIPRAFCKSCKNNGRIADKKVRITVRLRECRTAHTDLGVAAQRHRRPNSRQSESISL